MFLRLFYASKFWVGSVIFTVERTLYVDLTTCKRFIFFPGTFLHTDGYLTDVYCYIFTSSKSGYAKNKTWILYFMLRLFTNKYFVWMYFLKHKCLRIFNNDVITIAHIRSRKLFNNNFINLSTKDRIFFSQNKNREYVHILLFDFF